MKRFKIIKFQINMLDILRNKNQMIPGTLCILLFFVFSFLHSEFDVFTPAGDTHESHDFCLFIKSANTPPSDNNNGIKIQQLIVYFILLAPAIVHNDIICFNNLPAEKFETPPKVLLSFLHILQI